MFAVWSGKSSEYWDWGFSLHCISMQISTTVMYLQVDELLRIQALDSQSPKESQPHKTKTTFLEAPQMTSRWRQIWFLPEDVFTTFKTHTENQNNSHRRSYLPSVFQRTASDYSLFLNLSSLRSARSFVFIQTDSSSACAQRSAALSSVGGPDPVERDTGHARNCDQSTHVHFLLALLLIRPYEESNGSESNRWLPNEIRNHIQSLTMQDHFSKVRRTLPVDTCHLDQTSQVDRWLGLSIKTTKKEKRQIPGRTKQGAWLVIDCQIVELIKLRQTTQTQERWPMTIFPCSPSFSVLQLSRGVQGTKQSVKSVLCFAFLERGDTRKASKCVQTKMASAVHRMVNTFTCVGQCVLTHFGISLSSSKARRQGQPLFSTGDSAQVILHFWLKWFDTCALLVALTCALQQVIKWCMEIIQILTFGSDWIISLPPLITYTARRLSCRGVWACWRVKSTYECFGPVPPSSESEGQGFPQNFWLVGFHFACNFVFGYFLLAGGWSEFLTLRVWSLKNFHSWFMDPHNDMRKKIFARELSSINVFGILI